MFCQHCGTAMADTATSCPGCNTPVVKAGRPSSSAAVADTVKDASRSAFAALKGLAGNPVAGVPATYAAVGKSQARRIGLAFGVACALCTLLGDLLLRSAGTRRGVFDQLGFAGFLKLMLSSVAPFVSMWLGNLGARALLGARDGDGRSGAGSGADAFIAGAALLPVSIATLLGGLLGYGSAGAAAALAVFAGVLCALMLYAGYTRISRLSERAAAFAVPIVIVLGAWLVRVVASSVAADERGVRFSASFQW